MTHTNPAIAALISECLAKLQEAVTSFGAYSYNDKGPNEVMDVTNLSIKVRALQPAEAACVLRSVANSRGYPVRPEYLAGAIVVDLQDWDELFAESGMGDVLNDDNPEPQPGDMPVTLAVSNRTKPRKTK